jgi:F-type H+-transporting ATPase subunit epsilon
MKTFRLKIFDPTGQREYDDVVSFVGKDASGSFGIRADHARMITSLVVGLAQFRTSTKPWHYLALAGAILNFDDNTLRLATHRYLVDDDYNRISNALNEQLLAEETRLASMKERLHRMEEEVFRRLWKIGREGEPLS